jgi:ribosome-binding factor A
MDRVSEEFREVVAEEIQRLKDPRVGFVTVTGVTVSPDLRRARVFYTVLGDDRARRATAAALLSARSHLRTAVGREIRLKFTPELEFREDQAARTGERIEEIIRGLHEDESPGETTDAAAEDG